MSARSAWLAIGLLALVLVALRWSTLDTGLHMDDLAQRAMVEGGYPVARAPWDLYTFAGGTPEETRTLASAGALPWWSDPQLRLRSLRPLASVLVWADARWLSPKAAHVHSLLWWLAMLAAAGWALRPVLGGRWTLVAVALYGLDDAHVYPLAWLANRAALISGVFGWLTLGLFVRAANGGPARGLVLAATSAACMAAGEYGLCGLTFTATYALVVDERPWVRRMRALAPVLAPMAVYLVLHRLGGFGAAHSGVYLDPGSEPGAFLGAVAERAPLLTLDMLSGAPLTTLRDAVPGSLGPWVLAVLGVVAVTGVLHVLVTDPARRRVLAWAGLSAGIAILPVCASFLSERLTVLASLGAHIASAAFIALALERVRDGWRRFAVPMVMSLAVIAGHGVLATRSGQEQTERLRAFNEAGANLAAQMPVDDDAAASQRWVLLTAGDPMLLVYPPEFRAVAGHPRPASWTVLSLAPGPATMRRVSEHALELTMADGWFRAPLEGFFRRGDRPLALHDRVSLEGLEAEVVAVDPAGVPTTVRFTFDRALGDRSMRVLGLGARGFYRYPLAGVGATVPVPPGLDAVRAAEGLPPA
ncbi:MAG: hypothetical protein AAGA54_23825 [Myxococcota bacterium]